MGDKQDKYTIKLPGKSLLIFVLVASCVFVVYYFANMVTDLQNDTNKKSDLMWLQKILNERKRPQNQHRPVSYKSRFGDYDEDHYFWDTTADYTDNLDDEVDDKVQPDRKYIPFKQYAQQLKQRPFWKQSDETREKSNSPPLNSNPRKWRHPSMRSQWHLDDESNERSNSFGDRSESSYTYTVTLDGSTTSGGSADYINWLNVESDSGSIIYDSAKYSTTQKTYSVSSQSSFGDKMPDTYIFKDREPTPKSDTEKVFEKTSFINKDKLGISVLSKSAVSHDKPYSLIQKVGNKSSSSINGDIKQMKGNPNSNGVPGAGAPNVSQAYKHKWSIDKHAINNKTKSPYQQSINDSIAGQNRQTHIDSIDTQGHNLPKNDTGSKAREGANTLTGRSNSLILTSLLKKQEIPSHLNDGRKIDEIAEAKKIINIPDYIDIVDWTSEQSLDVKPECVPMSSVSSYVRICIHSFADDPEISARIRGHMGYEFNAMRDVQLALLQDNSMGLIDLGAGIGEYSLTAARVRTHVVAVEPYLPHVKLFQRSVHLNKLEEYVMLLKNVISDENEEYFMRHNAGHINDVIFSVSGKFPKNDSARSITLNQLSTVIPFKKAVLKVDIPNFTKKALTESNELFEKVDIKYVFTHWNSSNSALNRFLVGFFQRKGYQPALQLSGALLRYEDYKTWLHSSIIWHKTT